MTLGLLLVLVITALFLEVVSVSQGIALGIATVVGPILSQVLKNWIGTTGFKAVLLAAFVSGALAVAATFIAGEAHSIGDIVKNASAVFGLATILYRGFAAATDPGQG
jgi:hypothetical protein